MGGLAKRIPLVFWTFLVGSLAMAAVPPLISGFSSKDWILAWVWASPQGGALLWAVGLSGVLLTSTYTFRLIFLAFFGAEREVPDGHRPGALLVVPLVVLSIPALLLGLIETPKSFGSVHLFSSFIASALPGTQPEMGAALELNLALASELLSLVGIVLAYLLARGQARAYVEGRMGSGSAIHRFWFSGWGFDWLYARLFTRPYEWIARINQGDVVDWIARGPSAATAALYRALRKTQNGRLRWYATALGAGAVIIIAVAIFV